MGSSPSRNHSPATAQTRSPGAHHRSPHLDPLQQRLSLAVSLCFSLDRSAPLISPVKSFILDLGPFMGKVRFPHKSSPLFSPTSSMHTATSGLNLALSIKIQLNISKALFCFMAGEKSGLGCFKLPQLENVSGLPNRMRNTYFTYIIIMSNKSSRVYGVIGLEYSGSNSGSSITLILKSTALRSQIRAVLR